MEIISHFTGLLCGELTNHRCIPLTKAKHALMCYLICTWINGWANNRDAGDLRRHRAHYDATVIQACIVKVSLSFAAPAYIRGRNLVITVLSGIPVLY